MTQALDTIKLDKNVPIPLYYQLKKQVLAMIEDSTLKEGDMLPPENELCELLDVSRPTIRQAFGDLVTEGYLNRYKGKGTFVSKPKVEARFLSKLETFNDEMTAKGLTPHTEVISLEKKTGLHEAGEKLDISLDAPLIYLSRLRSANEVPLVYVETFLSYEQYPALMDVNFEKSSLYDSLEKLYHVRISRARREIEAVNARPREAEFLHIAKNKALSLVKTKAYSDDSPLPVEYSIARYRGDLNKFSVDIFR
jgi:GntR family transcriptional regulator